MLTPFVLCTYYALRNVLLTESDPMLTPFVLHTYYALHNVLLTESDPEVSSIIIAPSMFAHVAVHIHRALNIVLRTKPFPILAFKVKQRLLAAARLLAPRFFEHIYHTFELMKSAESPPSRLCRVEGSLHTAPSMLALVYGNHTVQLV
mmetsp:Transcript_7887/g.11959  ORF Transcript_7887/g.11959 Transcript_7887/m.11959 type:complete len:148 (-) Transcript_7887:140-583(-)